MITVAIINDGEKVGAINRVKDSLTTEGYKVNSYTESVGSTRSFVLELLESSDVIILLVTSQEHYSFGSQDEQMPFVRKAFNVMWHAFNREEYEVNTLVLPVTFSYGFGNTPKRLQGNEIYANERNVDFAIDQIQGQIFAFLSHNVQRQKISEQYAKRRQEKQMSQSQTEQNIMLVLKAAHDLHNGDPHTSVSDTDISRKTAFSLQDVRDYLNILERRGLTKAANTLGGYNAFVTSMGRLLLRDPSFGQAADSPSISINASHGAIVNFGSTLTSVTQTINASPNLDQNNKAELARLVGELSEALKQVPQDRADEAEAIADAAKDLVAKADKEKPNFFSLRISADGLKAAAENLASVVPNVALVATKITGLLMGTPS